MRSKHQTIKNRILQRAMELWGIENQNLIDPVIELLLDVFSYEFAKVEQEVKISDAKLLERISKILVKESWSLPMPSHALLRALPTGEINQIDRKTIFYYQKMKEVDEYIDLFFTPLLKHKLINGHISRVVKSQEMHLFDITGDKEFSISAKINKKIKDYTLWIGIDIENDLLNKIDELPLAFILRDSGLDGYLKLLKVFDSEGNELNQKSTFSLEGQSKDHYINSILRYYKDYLYTITLPEKKVKEKTSEKFASFFYEEDLKDAQEELFWIKIELPVSFNKDEINKLDVVMNTFPIVNRKLQYKQHNVKKNGKIISLTASNESFLNVESLTDNEGNIYRNKLTSDIDKLKGSFSLYFGDLEQFDDRDAKAVLEKTIQVVREEGSSFSAIGYDLLNAYLEDLNKKLDVIERKVSLGYKDTPSGKRKYLLTTPFDDSVYLESEFWTTNPNESNNIKEGKALGQFQTGELIPKTIRLQTDTIGGSVKDEEKEKINNLRYGLLSKDRIVSSEDVKSYIKKSLGNTVTSVKVSSAVGISSHKKGGLIRITKVEIVLGDNVLYTNENKKRLSYSLQKELEQKSVHNLPYSIIIE